MLCEVIMKTDVHYAALNDTAGAVARRMREHGVGFIPVCDGNGKVLGTVTDRDLALRVVAEERPAATPLADIMSREAVCCGAQEEIGRAQELMARHRKSRIMCVDEAGRLEGVISLSDIAQLENAGAARTLQQVSAREAPPLAGVRRDHPG